MPITSKKQALDVLNLTENATPEDIRKAYKKLAVKLHPDKNQGNPNYDASQFRDLQEAMEFLSPKNPQPAAAAQQNQDNEDQEYAQRIQEVRQAQELQAVLQSLINEQNRLLPRTGQDAYWQHNTSLLHAYWHKLSHFTANNFAPSDETWFAFYNRAVQFTHQLSAAQNQTWANIHSQEHQYNAWQKQQEQVRNEQARQAAAVAAEEQAKLEREAAARQQQEEAARQAEAQATTQETESEQADVAEPEFQAEPEDESVSFAIFEDESKAFKPASINLHDIFLTYYVSSNLEELFEDFSTSKRPGFNFSLENDRHRNTVYIIGEAPSARQLRQFFHEETPYQTIRLSRFFMDSYIHQLTQQINDLLNQFEELEQSPNFSRRYSQ